jgi:hypothetical protein
MVLPLLAIVLSLSSPVRPPSYALLLMSRTSLHGKMIVQVTSARISAPTAAASCAAEHQRIAALEAANALLNATVAEQAVEISELRGRLLGMPACEHLCLLSRSQASAHSIVAPCAGARAAGALWPSGSTGAALAPAESSPVRVKAHGTPTVRLPSRALWRGGQRPQSGLQHAQVHHAAGCTTVTMRRAAPLRCHATSRARRT